MSGFECGGRGERARKFRVVLSILILERRLISVDEHIFVLHLLNSKIYWAEHYFPTKDWLPRAMCWYSTHMLCVRSTKHGFDERKTQSITVESRRLTPVARTTLPVVQEKYDTFTLSRVNIPSE